MHICSLRYFLLYIRAETISQLSVKLIKTSFLYKIMSAFWAKYQTFHCFWYSVVRILLSVFGPWILDLNWTQQFYGNSKLMVSFLSPDRWFITVDEIGGYPAGCLVWSPTFLLENVHLPCKPLRHLNEKVVYLAHELFSLNTHKLPWCYLPHSSKQEGGFWVTNATRLSHSLDIVMIKIPRFHFQKTI